MDYVYFLVNRICKSKDYSTLPIFIQFFNFITMQKYIAFDDLLYNNLIEILYVFVDSDVQNINLTTSLFTELSNSDNILFSRFDKQKLGFYEYLLQNGCGYYTEIDDKNNINIIEKF